MNNKTLTINFLKTIYEELNLFKNYEELNLFTIKSNGNLFNK